jgi:hypothetical protein
MRCQASVMQSPMAATDQQTLLAYLEGATVVGGPTLDTNQPKIPIRSVLGPYPSTLLLACMLYPCTTISIHTVTV